MKGKEGKEIRLDEVRELDRVVHEPARLSILYHLSGGGSADFTFLMNMTGVAQGSLSNHLERLESAGLIETRKDFFLRRPRTRANITPKGEEALEEHWRQLNRLREKSIKGGKDLEKTEAGDEA